MNDLEQLQDFLGELPVEIKLPIPGLYFLFAKDQLLYIGQSKDVVGRIAEHIALTYGQFDRAFYVRESDQVRRLTRELELIGTFRPRLNRQPVNPKGRRGPKWIKR
jgi:excinuclease UvrABC nuclease subunit